MRESTSGLKWLYLGLMLFAGTVLVFLTPVYQLPDSQNHFMRAWQISEGIFLSPHEERGDGKSDLTAEVPAVFLQEKFTFDLWLSEGRYSFGDIENFLAMPLNDSERVKESINNTGPYAPIVYFPQALAAYITRSLGCTAGQIFYAMRFFAMLFAVLCVFSAMHILPEKNLLIFLISMMPMYLAESASVSSEFCSLRNMHFIFSVYIIAHKA